MKRQRKKLLKLQYNELTVVRNVKKSKEKGIIERVGGKKSGYWKAN